MTISKAVMMTSIIILISALSPSYDYALLFLITVGVIRFLAPVALKMAAFGLLVLVAIAQPIAALCGVLIIIAVEMAKK